MSATHRITVEANQGATVTLKISTLHPDEHCIWVVKTALVSMLYSALDAPRVKVAPGVRDTYTEAGGDEPFDARSAGKVLKGVGEAEVLAGTLKKRTAKKLVFSEGGAIRLPVEFKTPALGAHLVPELSWDTAPLFPELE